MISLEKVIDEKEDKLSTKEEENKKLGKKVSDEAKKVRLDIRSGYTKDVCTIWD